MNKSVKSVSWICEQVKGRRYIIVILSIIKCVSAALGISFAFLSKRVIDAASSGDMRTLAVQSVITVSVIIAQIILSYTSGCIDARASARLDKSMKDRLFESISRKDYSSVTEYHSGDLLTRLSSDVSAISDNVISLVPNLLSIFVTIVLALISLIQLDIMFSLVFIIGSAAFLLAVRLFGKYLKSLHKRVQAAVSKGNAFFQETIANLLMIKVFGIEPKISSMSGALQDKVVAEKIHRSNVYLFSSMGASMLFSLGSLYALIWSAYKIAAGAITYGTLTAILQLVNRFQSPVANLSSMIPGIFSILASADRIIEIESLPDEAECSDRLDSEDGYAGFGEIRFESVKFSYGSLPVIEDASFVIPKGSFIVISGHSGIGKSTLLKLLLGVYKPCGGRISVTVNGESLDAGTRTRPLFAYVPQGNMILSGTIRDTLTMVRPSATDDEIRRAAEISCAAEFLAGLPDGLDTEIGENGLGLSEGQVQRLAVTRAVLSGAGILLLDEATSALDSETEMRLLKNLRGLPNKTCIIISHKPSAFKVCDAALSVSRGTVKLYSLKKNENKPE